VVGGIRVDSLRTNFRSLGTAIYFDAPAHPAGPVDVVVTNPGGRADTLAGAYTYAEPETFDFNGEWWGFEIGPEHNPISFTVRTTCWSASGASGMRPPT
jgi:hypothetical protein